MRIAILTTMAFSLLFVPTCIDAQTPRAGSMRVYTFDTGPRAYGYPAFGYGDAYPELAPYRDQAAVGAGDSPYLDYLWPYRNPEGNRGAYGSNSRYGYPAGGYAWRDYLAPYRNSPRGYGRPTYPGVWTAYPYGSSPYLPYQGRRSNSGRVFPYSAAPTYQPRLGGMFDR